MTVGAPAFMDVTKQVQTWPETENTLAQLFTAQRDPGHMTVQNASRRSVGDENLGVIRYALPLLPERLASVGLKSPVSMCGRPGAAKDPHALNFAGFVLQISQSLKQCARVLLFQAKIMIARDESRGTYRGYPIDRRFA